MKTVTKENNKLEIKLSLDDSRRLTGKGLDWDYPGAIMDCFVSGIDKQQVVDCWQQTIDSLLLAVGWEQQHSCYRIFEDGISFLISAPMDALYAATELNEVAWQQCCYQFQTDADLNPVTAEKIQQLKKLISDEANPEIIEWLLQAEIHQVPCLVDDDEISLGYGNSCETWQVNNLPNLKTINWQQYKAIPIAMITGTNGKSTSVRLTSEMVKVAGINCGVTSTDFIKVADEIIDEGDYSGPGGARILLRHEKTELALLEVARGGLLRRGLAVEHIDAALITNIAEDHFGQYGINNLETLTQTKCIVAKALSTGTLVLNADDPQLVKASQTLEKNIVWFSLHKNNPVLVSHRIQQGACCFLDDEMMVYEDAGKTIEVISVKQVAMTFDGAARHNVENALGAIALAISLQIDIEAVRIALKNFNSDASDNPGRGNRFKFNGTEVVLDFAHNTHSMKAMAETVKQMPALNKLLMLSAAGDRSDEDIESMTEAAMAMQPAVLIIAEIEEYLRGREPGETSLIIKNKAIDLGQDETSIILTKDSLTGANKIISTLQSGDLALIMALTQRHEITQLLENQVSKNQ